MLVRLRSTADEGFSLVEILAAMVVFALMAMAVVPMIITGLRASTVAKLDTGAKNLAQERIEAMRNLPYNVPAAAVATSTDLLDAYFPNIAAAAGTGASGFVAAAAARRDGEPAGAFYRTVWNMQSDMGPYMQYVATQFLGADGTPAVPPTGWNRQVELKDIAPSQRVGVTVVTEWTIGTLSKSLVVFTQIGEGRNDAPIVTLVNRTTALKVAGSVDGSDLVLEAGKINIDGSVTTGTTAASSATGVYAAHGTLNRVEGATRAATAPPSQPAASGTVGTQTLSKAGGGQLVGFGSSTVAGVAASTGYGLPSTGSSGTPVQAVLQGGNPFTFTNNPAASLTLGIDSALPVVRVLNAAASENQVTVTGWSATTSHPSQAARTSTTAAVRTLAILPTTFAPDGLVQVALRSSKAECLSSPGTVTATATYTAAVKYWAADTGAGAPGYVTVTGNGGQSDVNGALVSSADTTDALASLLASNPLVRGTSRLADYFTGMSSRTAAGLTDSVLVNDRRAELSLPALLSITTQPLRSDTASSVVVDLASYSCVAEDRR